MHGAGDPRQITIGNVFQIQAGERVCQIANHGETMHGAGGEFAEFFVGVDEEHRCFGVVGVDREVTRHDLEHDVTPVIGATTTRGQTRVAAIRGLADRVQEPAHPKVSHAQPP
ncbi:hypothetical protein D9M70_630720 [compost metagenome]